MTDELRAVTTKRAPGTRPWPAAFAAGSLLLALLLFGCAAPRRLNSSNSRPFDFVKDTFAFANELVWDYQFDAEGKWVARKRAPKPDYTLHCFVVARCARQFFQNARFDPGLPIVDEAAYRRLIRRVAGSNPRKPLPEQKKIVIPGYSDLREFSAAQAAGLKAECGGAWESYFQRGHWRMIFPFRRHHQQRVAEQILTDLKIDAPLVVHLVRFPQLTINHAVIIYEARASEREIQFTIYDPNDPSRPGTLTFDRSSRSFILPPNHYFPGGRVDVYEIYRGCLY
jgi:hypothetical protein